MEKQKIPGAALAVVRRGEVLKARGYGLANVEHSVPVTVDTVFQSGSLGKQLTAAGVLALVDEGRIGLDDPLVRYFPDAPEAFRAITVRQLLTHTSGIPDYTTDTFDYRRDYAEDELVRMAFALAPAFPPGSRWSYSNTGYVLLGALVRRATGRFYGDVLQERVFVPLGMKTTRIISEEEVVPHRAAGYRLVDGKLKNQEWVAPKLNTTADGSLYFTLRDLIAWDAGLRRKAILKPESWTSTFTPVRLASGRTYPYGFGWAIDEAGGQAMLHHGGSWQGFKTYLVRYLEGDLTVIALANLAQADPEALAQGVAALIDPRLKKPEPTPIADADPAVASRVRELLAAARDLKLAPEQFAYIRAGFFPAAPKRYAEMLRGLGEPRSVTLLERRDLGDDRVSLYSISFADRELRLRLGIAPDGRLSAFSLWKE